MEKNEFVDFLQSEKEHFEMEEGELEGNMGIYVRNKVFDTQTHFTDMAIEQHELKDLIAATHHGKNIEQMTRVTGYFSKIEGWNKGKVGELNDRNRTREI